MRTAALSMPAAIEAEPVLLDAIRTAGDWFNHGAASAGNGQPVQDPSLRVQALAVFLYANWYAAPLDKPRRDSPVPLVESLRAADHGSGTWEEGWIAKSVSSAGRVVAVREREQRMLSPGDYVSIRLPGLVPPVGTPVTVVRRCDSTTALPGYWVTHSHRWFSERGTLARLYWNVQTAGAPVLVRQLTRALDRAPFCLKVPSEPAGFARADAAVLYVPAAMVPVLRGSLRGAHESVLDWLSPDTPPLTKPIGLGLGAAETRCDAAESFGQHRCRLIAQALLPAFQRRRPALADLLSAIGAQFLREGLTLSHPWLEPAGVDHYAL